MEEQKLKHVCKFCKKRFACGRSLGGHIRCHLPKPGNEQRKKKQKSNAATSSVSSETEGGNLRLSKRSCLAGNSSFSSLSEVVEEEHEEEVQEVDIAMCLIMLSRDVGPWGEGKVCHGKSSKNKRKRTENVQGKKMNAVFTAVNGEKQKQVSVASENLQKGVKMKEVEVSENGLLLNDQSFKLSENRSVKMEECRESKAGFLSADLMSNDHELGKFDENQMKTELFSRRSKFECVTCNKVFHSYQALGGHKASHKKLQEEKECYNPVEKAILSSIAECSSPDCNEKFSRKYKDEVYTEIGLGSSPTLSNKIAQKHECPICFRVFSSGQALGGHKRSHFLACNDNEAKISQSNQLVDDVIERSSTSKPRDMLDLNLLPEYVDEEDAVTANCTSVSSTSIVGLIKPYWWVENPHKHETLLSLISK